jgi:serine/threonine protein kinase
MGNCCKKKSSSDLLENFLKEEDNPSGLKLKLNDFERLKLLGKGSFGQVYLVKSKYSDKIYAMKILDKNVIREGRQEGHTKIERDLLVKINCPFIVNIKFSFQDKNNLYILTEFMPGGELFFHLHKERRFSNEKAKFYLIEMILALEYLHKKNMLYRDLKPENILIDRNGHIKLIDFGLSKILQKQKEKSYTICGTPQYLAPEILSDKGYDSTVDWWSLGCVFYEMLIGITPYKINLEDSLNKNLYKQKIFIPDYVTEEAGDLINKLLVIDPKKRLGFGGNGVNKIKSHPYFKNVNWDDGWNQKLIPPFIPKLNNETDLKYFDHSFTDESISSGDYSNISGVTMNNNEFKGFTYVSNSEGNELMVMNNSNDERNIK